MLIMRLVFSHLLLLIALGACFKATDAQGTTTQTDATTTITIPNINTVESTLSSEINSATPENTAVTVLVTVVDPHNSETTLVNQISTMSEEQTVASTPPLSTVIEQTSPESVSVRETTAQTEQTTVTTTTVPVILETTVTEQIPSEAPSTRQHESTVGVTSPEVTSPTDEITTAAVILATVLAKAINPTTILAKPDSDETPTITSDPEDTSIELSTTILTSTTKHPQTFSEVRTTFGESVTGASVIIEGKSDPLQNSWLIIMIVCVSIVIVLCIGIIVIIQRRKKNASRNFSPANGQSKRSKKKKGAENDAWAGPVNLEAGPECDAEAQGGLLPNDGKQDDDVVLSTFAALDAGDTSNGGVGGDGTKEAKKWEEQEPLLYIDEDVKENKAEKTPEENEKQKGDDKSEEKGMNGGETFCLTTAV